MFLTFFSGSQCKKNAHNLTKDREKTIEQVNGARDGKIKNVSEKDVAKVFFAHFHFEHTIMNSKPLIFMSANKSM